MARTAFYAPAHRVMGRVATGSGATAQPTWIAPSMDAVGHGIQDARWPWNNGSSASAPNVVGWYDPGCHPLLDVVPSTLTITAIAAAQAGVTGAMTLVSSTAAGITVSSSATYMLPSGVTIPTGTLFIDGVTAYRTFGLTTGSNEYSNTVCYDAATMLGRAVAIHSAGDDTSATAAVAGWDIYGYPQTETITLGNNATVNGKKAFKAIASVTLAGTLSGSNVGVGQSDVMGLPMLATAQSAIQGFYNALILNAVGTFVAADTATATATTGDVRGTYVPGSASNNSKKLTLYMHPSLSQMITSGVNVGMFGVTPA